VQLEAVGLLDALLSQRGAVNDPWWMYRYGPGLRAAQTLEALRLEALR
jgi:hypothetical protein